MNENISGIEIFSRIESDQLEKIANLFAETEFEQGTAITQFGEPVDGLYLVAEGSVDVTIPDYEGVLATLDKGKSFGEMSLFNSDPASATVTVKTMSATLLFCPKDALNELLSSDQVLAAGFYYSSVLMLTNRLRTTNEKISGEIAQSINMATSLIDEIAISGDLGAAQDDFHAAGSNIVTGMTNILKSLLAMKQSGEAIPPDQITRLADNAKDIYYTEFKVFDKVYDQLLQLGQHLDNIKRILSSNRQS